MKNDYSAIISVLQKYFDLLYKGDINLIKEVFYEDAHVYSQMGDEIVAIGMNEFRDRISERPSPERKGENRLDEISCIDMWGPKTALAKVRCNILGRVFTDYLSLFKVNNNWKIISKVFRSEEL